MPTHKEKRESNLLVDLLLNYEDKILKRIEEGLGLNTEGAYKKLHEDKCEIV